MSKPLTLGQAQRKFARMVGLLIVEAYKQGYEISLGWAFRPQFANDIYAVRKRGIASSLHTLKLAVDLNLFCDGKYLAKTSNHRKLGLWWEKQGRKRGYPLAWGGWFKDGNHYSWAWKGRK